MIHPRSVEIAMQHNIPIRIRSTMSDEIGTLVASASHQHLEGQLQERLITGIAQVPHVTQIRVHAKEGEYDLQLRVFKAMAENKISVDFINVTPMGVAYTVFDEVADKAVQILESMGYSPEIQNVVPRSLLLGLGWQESQGSWL